jgi:hypothetical protein
MYGIWRAMLLGRVLGQSASSAEKLRETPNDDFRLEASATVEGLGPLLPKPLLLLPAETSLDRGPWEMDPVTGRNEALLIPVDFKALILRLLPASIWGTGAKTPICLYDGSLKWSKEFQKAPSLRMLMMVSLLKRGL